MRYGLWTAAFAACLLAASTSAADLRVTPVKGSDKDDVAGYYDNGSKLLKALEYRDADGSYRILAFGGNDQGPTVDDKSYVSLHAYGLLQDHGGYITRWEIKDTNGTALCGVQMLTSLVNVIDAGNGEPLVVVPYWIACDGLDGTSVKLIMVYKDQKYAIRGNLPNQDSDTLWHKPGTNFAQLPPAVQKTAEAYWQKVEAAAKKAADWSDPSQ
ncbi:hypothetical protein [Dyella sp. GSA-30]|uniref:M949_RS01915 family surface polysaccharide biosynthesis protein n=1 Tax=Dyella sp. GSA-30 TaxID=2994496 RepID=UPI00249009FC|nr:hypothetical protein [Dyella sp. GSA-30]BDU18750.1 hypothetical protein DYGSA30_02070 [Dyella sp. GSA-30]